MQDPFKCKVKNQTYQLNTGLGSLGLDQRENTATGVLSSLKFQVENINARELGIKLVYLLITIDTYIYSEMI